MRTEMIGVRVTEEEKEMLQELMKYYKRKKISEMIVFLIETEYERIKKH